MQARQAPAACVEMAYRTLGVKVSLEFCAGDIYQPGPVFARRSITLSDLSILAHVINIPIPCSVDTSEIIPYGNRVKAHTAFCIRIFHKVYRGRLCAEQRANLAMG